MHGSVHLENEETKEAKGPSSFSGGLISFTSTWEAPRKTQMPSSLPVKKHIIICAKQHLWINTMWLYIYIYIYIYIVVVSCCSAACTAKWGEAAAISRMVTCTLAVPSASGAADRPRGTSLALLRAAHRQGAPEV